MIQAHSRVETTTIFGFVFVFYEHKNSSIVYCMYDMILRMDLLLLNDDEYEY